jgi:hypothetical protein
MRERYCPTCGLDQLRGPTGFFSRAMEQTYTDPKYLPPRPVKTSWIWHHEWDNQKQVLDSPYRVAAREVFEGFKERHPDVFDGVECRPMVKREDGPDEVWGYAFTVTLWPYYCRFALHSLTVDERAWRLLAHCVKNALGAHQKARRTRFAALTPLPMLCVAHYWYSDGALETRLATYQKARERMAARRDPRLASLEVQLGPPLYADPREQ